MKYINFIIRAEVTDNVYGKVSDEAWEKYQNGEITLNTLYSNYFTEHDTDNLEYEVTEIEEVEVEEDD